MADVDSFRFLDFATTRVVKAWMSREPKRPVPFVPLRKPLSQCRVAILSSAAISRRDDTPFDLDGERRNPFWGDPSLRTIPKDSQAAALRVEHLHIDRRYAERDLDTVLPLRRLDELIAQGIVGSSAPTHYSMMGYQLDLQETVQRHLPPVIARMQAEAVDAVLLVPV